MTHHIALYGNNGVGTTTLAANISVSLADAGFTSVLVGCSRGGDSSVLLNGGFPVPSAQKNLDDTTRHSHESIGHTCYKGITCIELAEPATNRAMLCADVSNMLYELDQCQIFEQLKPDFVMYDISGDNSSAVLQAVLEHGHISRLFLTTTADFKAIQAINEVFGFLELHNSELPAPVPMGGLILNSITSSFEEAFVNDFAYHTSARTIGKVPRSLVVKQSELYGQTVIQSKPLSNQSYYYRRLANQIVDTVGTIYSGNLPRPMSPERLRAWSLEWADRIYALENGLVADGAAI